MNDIIAWYQAREPRERMLLIAAASLVIFLLAFLIIVRPMMNAYYDMEQQLQQEKIQLPWFRKTVRTIQSANPAQARNQVRSNESIQTVINRSAKVIGVSHSIRRIEPHGESEALVSMQDANFNRVIAWIEQLKLRYGLSVTKVSFSKRKIPGHVDARITFKRN
jgi:general secretion pathway protein M